MQGVRDLLRESLGRSLRSLPEEDRLAAAWPVACGAALAARAEVLGLDADRVLHVRVLEPGWREQFLQMRSMLTEELRRIAGVRLETIHFEGQPSPGGRARQPVGPQAAKGPGAAQRKERRRTR
ncbi:MAG TPA: DciA family protein [Acidobacteriaceae bacterium]|jgi:hypothetical protein